MTTTFEKLSSNKVKLGFTVEPEKFDEGLQTAYRKLVKQITIPGFRRGKAPMRIIESHYGPSVFYEDAFEAIFPEIYRAALEEHGVEPVDSPELDVQQIGRGQELKFTVEVFVRPDVKLGAYKNLGIKKEPPRSPTTTSAPTSSAPASAPPAMSRSPTAPRSSTIRSTSTTPAIWATCSSTAARPRGTTSCSARAASSPALRTSLSAPRSATRWTSTSPSPRSTTRAELAGKAVVFKVKVNSIREKDVPALDDDFVTEVSEKANTVDEYRAEIRETLEKRADANAERAFEDAVVDAVSDNAEVDIPKAMVDDEINAMLRDMEMRLAYQGMKLDDFVKYTGQTIDQLREQYRPGSEERVRKNLVLEAVMKAENIAATDEEVDAEIADYAKRSGQKPEDLRKAIGEDGVKRFAEMASLKKTVDFLKANAE